MPFLDKLVNHFAMVTGNEGTLFLPSSMTQKQHLYKSYFIALRLNGTLKYGDFHEKFDFLKMRFKTLEHLSKTAALWNDLAKFCSRWVWNLRKVHSGKIFILRSNGCLPYERYEKYGLVLTYLREILENSFEAGLAQLDWYS